MDRFFQDVRYGFRTFLRQPGVAATAILALALGIGANTAVFSVVYAVLLKPLPFPDPQQLVYVHDTYPAVTFASVSLRKLEALRDRNRTLVGLAGTSPVGLTLTGRGDPEQIGGTSVTDGFFKVLGVTPAHGRPFLPEENAGNGSAVIMLSYGLWQRRFGGDPAVVGQSALVDGVPRVITGVMPQGFTYPGATQAWIPLPIDAAPSGNFMRLVGRARPGVTVQQVQHDLDAVSAEYNRQTGLQRDVKVWALHEIFVTTSRRAILVLQGAVVFVLLIACANVANLLLARSVSRTREFAIRTAIGARRFRNVRQLLTESVMLAVLGGLLGVILASWLLRLFVALAPAGFPRLQGIAIDERVLAFTLGVSTITGILFGLAPARHGFRIDPNAALRDAGARGATAGGTRGASRVLVVAEVALALVLVIGAALMVKSLVRLQNQEIGFEADGLLTFEVNLPRAKYAGDAPNEFYRRFLDDVRAIPGVEAAAAINHAPLVNFGFNGPFTVVGQPPFEPGKAPVTEYRWITPGYFATMRIPIKQGQEFTERNNQADRPVVIVNETMVRRYFGGMDPIGARIQVGGDPSSVTRDVIGVVGDVRSWQLAQPPVPEVYMPVAQAPGNALSIVARIGQSRAESVLPAVRERLARLDPNVPIVRPRTMNAIVDLSAGGMRLSSVLTSVFALIAALLATVGVYSIIAYSVARRTREIGIRVALGANRRSVVLLILGEGLSLAAAGIAIGVAGAFLVTRTLETMLYEVSPTDPAVLAGTCAALLAIAAFASLIPAIRALRVDPMVALRAE